MKTSQDSVFRMHEVILDKFVRDVSVGTFSVSLRKVTPFIYVTCSPDKDDIGDVQGSKNDGHYIRSRDCFAQQNTTKGVLEFLGRQCYPASGWSGELR